MRQDLERAFARELRRGGRMLAIAAVVVLGWAGFVPLSGAVVVAGRLVVQSSVKKVQHPQGGIVASILVRNGTKVAAGEELARLDQTSARSNLQVVARQLDEVRMRIARLTAERDNVADTALARRNRRRSWTVANASNCSHRNTTSSPPGPARAAASRS